jgi:hypothetical protein
MQLQGMKLPKQEVSRLLFGLILVECTGGN